MVLAVKALSKFSAVKITFTVSSQIQKNPAVAITKRDVENGDLQAPLKS
jgi:hypothetical protein